MNNYQEHTYGDRIAGIYDELYAEYEPAVVETLRELAPGGRALELGIGTGRIALPLQESGVEVHGIDASTAMVARLRAKPGGEQLPVTLGNFGDVAVEGQFDLIYVLFNTFYALLTQEEQVRCFQNVARRLASAGVFVIEAFFPDLNRFQRQQKIGIVQMGLDEVRLDASQVDPVKQEITAQHIILSEQGTRLFPVRLRYAWPAEFDLMARIAGLQLKHRWGSWGRIHFRQRAGNTYRSIPYK